MTNIERPSKDEAKNLELESKSQFPLEKTNFLWMGVSALLIIIGFLLMLGGSSEFNEFNTDIFSTRRIVIGPLLAFIGFVGMGVAIIIKPKN